MLPFIRRTLSSQKGLVQNGLVAEYRFNEGAGQILTNYVNNINGMLGSSAGADTNDPTWTSQGLSFTTDDYITLNHDLFEFNGAPFTMEVVLRGDPSVIRAGIISKGGSGSEPARVGYYFRIYNGKVNFMLRDNVTSLTSSGSKVINDGLYHHVVFAKDADTLVIYVDKVMDKQIVCTNIGNMNNAYVPKLGVEDTGGNLWKGIFSYFNRYNRKLSVSEVIRNNNYFKTVLAQRGIVLL